LAKAFTNEDGCLICHEDRIKLDDDDSKWPSVTIGVFIEQPTPFLVEFFTKISNLKYPKSKLSLLIHNTVKQHSKVIETFIGKVKTEYSSIKYIKEELDSPEHEARSEAIEECKKNKCEYYFSIDSTVHLDNDNTLKLLIEQNRPILAPIMVRPGSSWSNVWGAVSMNGFYERSFDYLDMINRDRLNVWNLPFISEVMLINGQLLNKIKIEYEDTILDPTMKFAKDMREKYVFMYGTNMESFGHLINPETYDPSKIKPELFEIINNLRDWTEKYIHPEYKDYVTGEKKLLEPCPDVFWFPVVNDLFCDDVIEMMEDYGKWSGGNDNVNDERLPGGYENVPTVDIHTKQVSFEKEWLHFLKVFIQPIQRIAFLGYFSDVNIALFYYLIKNRVDSLNKNKVFEFKSTFCYLNLKLNLKI
jgi:procollagen-lysine,2-oxoglutarate 5-dioxygenase, invertebrate